MSRGRSIAIRVVLLVALVSAPAAAQPPARSPKPPVAKPAGSPASKPAKPPAAGSPAARPTAAARAAAAKHFDDGVRSFNSGAFGAARTEFEKAYALTKAWQMLFYIGICQSRELHYLAAIATLARYLSVGAKRVPVQKRTQALAELESLRALLATVTVKVNVPGAEVRIGERVVGRSPLAKPVAVVPKGKAQIVSALKEGYKVASKRLTVAAGGRATVTLSLERLRVLLALDSVPPGAKARVDGEPAGTTPLRRSIVVGRHEVALSLDGYHPQSKSIVAVAGQPHPLTLHLRALPATPWYKRWYIWTGIGVIVVGALVTGLVIASNQCPADNCTGALGTDGR